MGRKGPPGAGRSWPAGHPLGWGHVTFPARFLPSWRRFQGSALTRPFQVLLVDDNPADLLLAQEVFSEYDGALSVTTCSSGRDALDRLRSPGTRPDVVILDVNMPVMGGFEVLQAIKDDPALVCIPVVMLSTSSHPGDVARAYTLHASSYMVKSSSFQAFMDQVDAFVTFWRESRTPSWPERAAT